jgi:hypothetical protein
LGNNAPSGIQREAKDPLWKGDNKAKESGGAPSTRFEPKWWINVKPVEKQERREVFSKWDCCVKPPENKHFFKPDDPKATD